jgi:uncharacterized protein
MSQPARSVAVIGASSDRRKFGNKAVRAFVAQGWQVFPVNPNEVEVEGLATVSDIAQVPQPLDAVTIYVPPAIGTRLLPAIAAAQPREVWVNPGAGSPEFRQEAERLQVPAMYACSIVAIGRSPSEFPDA